MTPGTTIPPITLTDDERAALEQLIQTDANPTVAWRARALLLLDQGLCSAHVARQVGVTKQCMAAFVPYYVGAAAAGLPMAERIQPGPDHRLAEYRLKVQGASAEVMQLLAQSPSAYGLSSRYWTIALLAVQVSRNLEIPISYETVRFALKRLGYSRLELRKGRPTD